MMMIPKSWKVTTIGDIFETTSGGTPSRKNKNFYTGNIPWVKSGELNYNVIYDTEEKVTEDAIAKSSAKLFPKGTLLIALYGATIGKLAFLGIDAATNQAVCGIYGNTHTELRYLYYYLLFKRPKFIENSIGGAQPNISQQIVRRTQVPIPPLPEQERIVAKIEELFSLLDAGVESLHKARSQLKIYRQAVLKYAFEGKLTAEWRTQNAHTLEPAEQLLKKIKAERDKQYLAQVEQWESGVREWERGGKKGKKPAKPKQLKVLPPLTEDELNELPQLPEGWTWVKVEELHPIGRECSYGVLKPGVHISDGVILIRVGDINNGKIDQSKLKRIAQKIAANYKRTSLSGGEILITLVGAIGRTAVVPKSLSGANTARAVGVIPIIDCVNINYVELFLRNPKKVEEMTNLAHEVARKTLNLEDVRKATIALAPINEQQQIVLEIESRLSVCDKLEQGIDDSLKKAQSLRQSILKKAFVGKLVPQVPSDPPAYRLLEQIKKEKENKRNHFKKQKDQS